MSSQFEREIAAMRMHTPESSVRAVCVEIDNRRHVLTTVRVGRRRVPSLGLGLALLVVSMCVGAAGLGWATALGGPVFFLGVVGTVLALALILTGGINTWTDWGVAPAQAVYFPPLGAADLRVLQREASRYPELASVVAQWLDAGMVLRQLELDWVRRAAELGDRECALGQVMQGVAHA